MNDREMDLEIIQISKKLDDVSMNAFLVTMRALAIGATMQQAVEVGDEVLIKAGRKPISPEMFEQPG